MWMTELKKSELNFIEFHRGTDPQLRASINTNGNIWDCENNEMHCIPAFQRRIYKSEDKQYLFYYKMLKLIKS